MGLQFLLSWRAVFECGFMGAIKRPSISYLSEHYNGGRQWNRKDEGVSPQILFGAVQHIKWTWWYGVEA